MTDWIKAGNGGESWKPEVPGESIIGTYVRLKTGVGVNNSNVYILKEKDKDDETSVWGSTVLDSRFEEIPLNSEVKITFLGKEKGKSPMPYKNFEVLYIPATPQKVNEVFPGAEVL